MSKTFSPFFIRNLNFKSLKKLTVACLTPIVTTFSFFPVAAQARAPSPDLSPERALMIFYMKGFSDETGWVCEKLDETTDLLNETSGFVKESYLTRSLWDKAKAENLNVCVNPSPTALSKMNARAAFIDGLNTIFISGDGFAKHTAAHELWHLVQEREGAFRLDEEEVKGNLTVGAQLTLAHEAAAYTFEAFAYYQSVTNHLPAQPLVPRSVQDVMMKKLVSLLEKNPDVAERTKDLSTLPPADLADTLMAHYLNHQYFSSNLVEGYFNSFLQRTSPTLRPPSFSFEPYRMSMEEIRTVTTGSFYPKGTAFPLTQKAVNSITKTYVKPTRQEMMDSLLRLHLNDIFLQSIFSK